MNIFLTQHYIKHLDVRPTWMYVNHMIAGWKGLIVDRILATKSHFKIIETLIRGFKLLMGRSVGLEPRFAYGGWGYETVPH